jgi:hypothetical protein
MIRESASVSGWAVLLSKGEGLSNEKKKQVIRETVAIAQ